MFKNVFEVKPREKKIRTTLEVVKKDRVTKILLPDNTLQLTKDDKVILVTLEDGRVGLTKVKPEYPTSMKKNAVLYNIGDNSINSQPIAKYIQDLFGFVTESFSLLAQMTVIDETEILILVDKLDEYVDVQTNEELSEDFIDVAIEEYEQSTAFL